MQLCLGVLVGGDIDHEAVPDGCAFARSCPRDGHVADPDDPSVASDHAVFRVKRLGRCRGVCQRALESVPVELVNALQPAIRLRHELGRVHTQERFDLRADVDKGAPRPGGSGVGDGGDRLDHFLERSNPVAAFAPAEPLVRHRPRGHG